MLKFICDNCNAENTHVNNPISFDKESVPWGWITVDLKYYNDRESDTRKLIVGHGLHHFCRQQCLIDYLFFKEIDKKA